MRVLPNVVVALVMVPLALVATAPANGAAAQSSSFEAPQAGARIRVSHIGATPNIGTVLARTNDGMVVGWANGGSDTVAMRDVIKLEVSQGQTRHVGRGALIGSGVGAVIGVIAKMSLDRDARNTRDDLCADGGAVGCIFGIVATGPASAIDWVVIPVSTLMGTGIGALFGSIQTDQWRESRVRERDTRVGLVPSMRARGVALVVSGRF